MSGIMVVLGTRPEAIKLWPVMDALSAAGIPTRLCLTGQHGTLLDQSFWKSMPVTAPTSLRLMRPGQAVGKLTGRMIAALDGVFAKDKPERVIVQGDTATALAAAQAAYFRGIPVAHLEAGLRTGELSRPHPEEGNRRMIGAIADMHFSPTATAVQALRLEGIDRSSIYLTGNTVVDALFAMRAELQSSPDLSGAARPVIDDLGDRHLLIVTCHRRENLEAVAGIGAALRAIAARPDVLIAIPVHPNPAIQRPLTRALKDIPNVRLLQPLTFASFVALLSAAHIVLTDSGGIQEEAPVLGVPVLVLRDTTERPEGVAAGTARLVGTHPQRIVAEVCRLLDNPTAHARMARKHSPYGDGQSATRVAQIIATAHGYGDKATLSAE